jgi:hypothetical protein
VIQNHHITAALAEEHRSDLLAEAANQRLARAGRPGAVRRGLARWSWGWARLPQVSERRGRRTGMGGLRAGERGTGWLTADPHGTEVCTCGPGSGA